MGNCPPSAVLTGALRLSASVGARPAARRVVAWVVLGSVLTSWGAARGSAPEIRLKDRQTSLPMVLSEDADYTLDNVFVTGVTDAAALTLTGRVRSVAIHHGRFGDVTAGANNKASALEAAGAIVNRFIATDSAFFDAEHLLVSLRDGSFGTVTFQHCTFKTSEAFLKRIYAESPGRVWPPTTEFYNIERLELLDNEYGNTTIVIHPSVKMVIFRGDISKIQVESPNTQVLRLAPHQDPASVFPANAGALADETPVAPAPDDPSAAPAPTPAAADAAGGPGWSRDRSADAPCPAAEELAPESSAAASTIDPAPCGPKPAAGASGPEAQPQAVGPGRPRARGKKISLSQNHAPLRLVFWVASR